MLVDPHLSVLSQKHTFSEYSRSKMYPVQFGREAAAAFKNDPVWQLGCRWALGETQTWPFRLSSEVRKILTKRWNFQTSPNLTTMVQSMYSIFQYLRMNTSSLIGSTIFYSWIVACMYLSKRGSSNWLLWYTAEDSFQRPPKIFLHHGKSLQEFRLIPSWAQMNIDKKSEHLPHVLQLHW